VGLPAPPSPGSYTRARLCRESLAFTIECGPVGGLPTCGECLGTPIARSSWGALKSRYRATGDGVADGE